MNEKKIKVTTFAEIEKAKADEKKFLDRIFALYDREKTKENFSEELFWNRVEKWNEDYSNCKGCLTNFSDILLDLADSIDYDAWKEEQLQQIEELEKDLPEFKKDK